MWNIGCCPVVLTGNGYADAADIQHPKVIFCTFVSNVKIKYYENENASNFTKTDFI
jgi:hypothetical protein